MAIVAIEAKEIIQTMYKGEPTALQTKALKMAYEALDKQIPAKVPDVEHFGRCPECDGEFNSELLNEYNIMFCPWCGQALDWDD